MELRWKLLILGLLSQDALCLIMNTKASSVPSKNDLLISRNQLLRQATACGIGLASALNSGGRPAIAAESQPQITNKVFMEFRIMEPLTEANNYSSYNAYRGKVVFGLYGKEAPKTVESFLSYMVTQGAPPVSVAAQLREQQAGGVGDEEPVPSYASSLLTRLVPGEYVEGGRVTGLQRIQVAGYTQLEYRGRIVNSPPCLESNELRHTTRGLLSKKRLDIGPEFAITVGPAPDLDGSNVVFGRVLEGDDVLKAIEAVPVYTSGSTQEPGSFGDKVFRAQREASLFVGKQILNDDRAIDRVGQFLRRIDVTQCSIL